jgi:hypothetical protein
MLVNILEELSDGVSGSLLISQHFVSVLLGPFQIVTVRLVLH